jgi:hypothetical protein
VRRRRTSIAKEPTAVSVVPPLPAALIYPPVEGVRRDLDASRDLDLTGFAAAGRAFHAGPPGAVEVVVEPLA